MNAMTDPSKLQPPPGTVLVAALARTAATAAKSSAAADTIYGVLQIGTTHIALPLDVLREVIPCPAQFSGLPAAAAGLLGAISVRGRVLPVLDLRVVLGLEAPRCEGQVVVVMRQQMREGGALLGLLTDGVRGLTKLPAGTLNAMSSGSQSLLFSGSFERAEDRSVVSVLDAAAVMRLPGVPLLQDDGGNENSAAAAATAHVPRCALMLVRCGDVRLAMEVTDIHTTLPEVTLQPSSMDGRVCRGVIEHAGVKLPAIDPLALMSLGELPNGEPCQALLLRFPTGLVALLVSKVIDIVRVPETDLLALSPLAVRRPELFRAALRVPGHGDHLVLARNVLQNEPDLLALSTLNATPGVASGTPAAASATTAVAIAQARGSAVITYDIGAEVATRLTQVIEVLPLPADHARPASGHAAVVGMFTHRGHSVTLVCLSSLLDGSVRPDPLQARVLVVGVDGAHFGFIVPRLCHIESTVWEAPRKEQPSAKPSALGRHAVVEIGTSTQRRTLHLVDLHALAQGLMRGEAEAPSEDADSFEALAVV